MARDEGLAAASATETTSAPKTMYKEVEQDEEVARGHVKVMEIIVYEFDRMEEVIDEFTGQSTGRKRKVEKSRGPYWYQTKEQEVIFKENNPGVRTESFNVQLLKSTAIKYLNAPGNMKQFIKKGVDNG